MKLALAVSAAVLAAGSAAFSFADLSSPEAMRAANEVTVTRSATPPAAPAPAPAVWRRPPGPPRVALQAGHWLAMEAPDEQSGLRNNGTRGGGKAEWEVNLDIVRRAAALLQARGYEVEVLPTTIPPGYLADLFVSVHADGHSSSSISGFRAAAPRRDATGRAAEFVRVLERAYGDATGLNHYPSITRRMTGYYAFNYRRYRHALHPMTPAAILETGFLTSPRDRRIIVDAPDRAAKGIADAVQLYLSTVDLEAEIVLAQETVPYLSQETRPAPIPWRRAAR
jgi:N-acetylmuramoyl-L-alanine amidase